MMIDVSTWGRFGSFARLGCIRVCRPDDGRTIDQAIADSIARRLGLQCVTLRGDGYHIDEIGRRRYHYVTTLGRPCRGGGWTPAVEVWFAYTEMA